MLDAERWTNMTRIWHIVALLVAGLTWQAVGNAVLAADDATKSTAEPTPAQLDFFEKKIRPVLVQHCYQCHSEQAEKSKQLKGGLRVDSQAGLRQGGDSGPAVVPGKIDESQLIAALKYESVEMPPKGKLPAAVIADFETWIRDGAVDPRKAGAGVRRTGIDVAAGRKFWSYVPPRELPLPSAGAHQEWRRGPIDAWIAAGFTSRQLASAPDASRETLIRRLYFDLTGLPPPVDEIDALLADESPDAVARLVERLLASPRFGERWARHWLDVARYAESLTLRGFILPEAWRYRDYVIDTFNVDRPIDQFIAEQVAGDLMPSDDLAERRRRLIATTFLVLGNSNLEEQDKGQLQMDVVDEQLETIGKGFLGQTIGCARCHDHKFDPIPTRDYYALAGILRSTKALEHSNVSKWLEFPLPVESTEEEVFKRHEAAVAALQGRIKAAKDAAKVATTSDTGGGSGPAIIAAKDLPGIVLDDSQAKKVGDWTLSQHSKRYIGDGYLHDQDQEKGEKTLTFVPELPKAGMYEVRFAYSPGGNRCDKVPVTVFSTGGEKTIHVNEQETPPIDGRFVSLGEYRFETNGQGFVIVETEDTKGHVIVDAVQFLPLDADPAPKAGAKPAAPALSQAGGQAGVQGAAKPSAKPDAKPAADDGSLKKLEAELKQLVDRGPKRPMFMSVQEEREVGDTKVHIRGLVSNLGETVPRGFLQVASLSPTPVIPPKESGRRELGAWLASADNPLTARVFANRVWHWMFGSGIVRTCDNFGATGELPSHPELLDALAIGLTRSGWSTKDLVREMALSHTYQLSSATNSTTIAADPENRWFARANRRRLDAECLLDAVLATSDRLRLEMGGPLLKPGISADYGYQHQTTRRAVYWPLLRNALPEMLEVFDLADPSLVTGRRNVSTVAPQALFMMNDSLVLNESREAARRLIAAEPADDARRLELAYRRILGRRPTDAEQRAALDYLAANRPAGADGPSQEAIWTQLAQALFASLDFRYVE